MWDDVIREFTLIRSVYEKAQSFFSLSEDDNARWLARGRTAARMIH
jgi:hypothetical protein